MRYRPFGAVMALSLATTFGPYAGIDSLLAQEAAPSGPRAALVELRLDAERVDAAFGDALALPTGQLLESALDIRVEGEAPELRLIGHRLADGQIVGSFESPPFRLSATTPTPVAGLAGLPPEAFYGSAATVERDGLATALPSDAASAASDPVGIVTGPIAGRPADWYGREVVYLAAVPADESLRAGTSIVPVVLYGAEVVTLATASGGTGPYGTPTDDPKEMLRRSAVAQQWCRGWVRNVTLYKQVEGFIVPEYHEAVDGGPACRIVQPWEIGERWEREGGYEPVRPTHEMAAAYDITGDVMNQELSREGVPAIGALADQGFGLMADFLHVAADIDPEQLAVDDPEERASDFAEFMERAVYVGTAEEDGLVFHHLRADGLNIELERPVGGPDFFLKAASLWIMDGFWVQQRLLFEVEARENGKVRPLKLELRNEDFILLGLGPKPGDLPIVIPMRQVMRITGLTEAMSEEDREKMREAVEEVAKMEKELEKMPPAMQGMLRSQIERLKRMTGDEGTSLAEATIGVIDAAVNEGPPYSGGHSTAFVVEGVLFDGAMVAATWYPLHEEKDEDGYPIASDGLFMFPQSLSFRGRNGDGLEGWLEFQVAAYSMGGEGHVSGSGLARGGVELPDGTTQTIDGQGTVLINGTSVTLVIGAAFVQGSYGYFAVGHQPCSTAPRTFSFAPLEEMELEYEILEEEPEILWDLCRKNYLRELRGQLGLTQ